MNSYLREAKKLLSLSVCTFYKYIFNKQRQDNYRLTQKSFRKNICKEKQSKQVANILHAFIGTPLVCDRQ